MYQAPPFPTLFDVMRETLQNLESLAELLEDEVRSGTIDQKLTLEARRRKELLQGVKVMMPRLKENIAAPAWPDRQLQMPVCIGCDDPS